MQQHFERRSASRVPISEFIELHAPETTEKGRALAVNLSATGIAVEHCALGNVGDRLTCALPFMPRAPLEVDARVVWVRCASVGQPAATGLSFEDLTERRELQLRRFVNHASGVKVEGAAHEDLVIDPFCESGTWLPGQHGEADPGCSEAMTTGFLPPCETSYEAASSDALISSAEVMNTPDARADEHNTCEEKTTELGRDLPKHVTSPQRDWGKILLVSSVAVFILAGLAFVYVWAQSL